MYLLVDGAINVHLRVVLSVSVPIIDIIRLVFQSVPLELISAIMKMRLDNVYLVLNLV